MRLKTDNRLSFATWEKQKIRAFSFLEFNNFAEFRFNIDIQGLVI
jgi:hypothetical protein